MHVGVNAAAPDTPVLSGSALALLTVGGTTGLYSIDLTTGAATLVGNSRRNDPGERVSRSKATSAAFRRSRFRPTGPTWSASTRRRRARRLPFRSSGITAGETLVAHRLPSADRAALWVRRQRERRDRHALHHRPADRCRDSARGGSRCSRRSSRPAATASTSIPPSTVSASRPTPASISASIRTTVPLAAFGHRDQRRGDRRFGCGLHQQLRSVLARNAATTLYTLDPASDTLFIQNPANAGTQISPQRRDAWRQSARFHRRERLRHPGECAASRPRVLRRPASVMRRLTIAGLTSLYLIDLATGAATEPRRHRVRRCRARRPGVGDAPSAPIDHLRRRRGHGGRCGCGEQHAGNRSSPPPTATSTR